MTISNPRIAILGAGPTGLEAALAAADAGHDFTVYEAAHDAAGRMCEWGHVRLFTPWDLDVSPMMRAALQAIGHEVPASEQCPTGAELVDRVLGPVSSLSCLAPHIRYGVSVVSVGRTGLLKHEEIGTGERGRHPFRLLLRDASGEEWTDGADIVIDCTGNTQPNALGDGGIPAPGEGSVSDLISHDVPDVAGEPDKWAGRSVLVVGAGHSAATAVVDLVRLAETRSDTNVVWALRHDVPQPERSDPLPQRAGLLREAAGLAVDPPDALRIKTGVVVDALSGQQDTDTGPGRPPGLEVRLRTQDGKTECVKVHHVLALTGRVGDHLLYRQLQVHECWATQGPMKLAAALLAQSGESADCLDQTSLGAETLINPEPGLFILGLKSYGRRNDYLLRVGWEQVSEVFALIAAR